VEEKPKAFDEAMVKSADVVITMGCGEECPYFPGKRYLDWEVQDPHEQPLEQVRAIIDDIEQRVRGLLVEMNIPPADARA
jgi:protein-tyrosine-phosphatase